MKRLLMCALVVVAWMPTTAGATTTTTGAGTIAGTVDLTQGFPCNCALGAFSGSVELSLSGAAVFTLDGAPEPYTAAWTGLNNTTANFGYDESCINQQPDNSPPLLGSASGSFMVSGGVLTLGANTFTASLSGSFAYQRIGTAVRIVLTNLVVSDGAAVAANLDNLTLVGQSADVIAFEPPVGTCIDQVVPQLAQLAGVALQPA